MKKFFYFLFFLILLSLAFFLYWYFSQKGVVPKIPFLGDNPFGLFPNGRRPPINGNQGEPNPSDNTTQNGTTTIVLPEEKLFELVTKDPTAGYSFSDFVTYSQASGGGEKKVSTTTALLYVDRGSGHIFKKFVFKNTPAQKITNTTFPGIYDAYFFANNTKILMRYLRESDNTIISLYGTLPPLSSSVILPLREVTKLPENVVSVAVSPLTGDLYYLVKTNSGSSLYHITNSGEEKIHDYDLSELTLSFNKGDLILSQKPSAFEKSYFFTMDEQNLYGGRTGQKVTFSKVNKGVFLSSLWSDLGLQLFSDDLTGRRTHVFTAQTLADKCLSSTLGSYFFCFVPNVVPLIPFGLPDDWYKGLVSFNDSLFVIDTVKYEENKLSRLETDTGEEMDVFKPVMSSKDIYMAFSNKINNELWAAQVQKIIAR